MKKSIARQLTAVFIGVMALVIGAMIVLNLLLFKEFTTRKMQSTLIEAYAQINEHVSEEKVDEDFFTGSFSKMCSANNINLIILDSNYEPVIYTVDNNARVMAARLFGYKNGLDQSEPNVRVDTEAYKVQINNDVTIGMRYLEMWGDLDNGNMFMMRIPMGGIELTSRISIEFLLYIGLAGVLVSIFLIWVLSRRMARPLKELTELSQKMSNLDFNARYTSGGQDEIGQLGMHFNKMSDTLQQTISELKSANNQLQRDIERKTQIDDMRKEFLSNVSHELKTPLALISGYAEGLVDGMGDDDKETRDFYCEVIMDETGKMTKMVQKLLTLNQLEFGEDKVELERFDLHQLIQGKIQANQLTAQQKDATIRYEGPESLHVWGDEFKIEEVLTNYISNAFNHLDGERRILVRSEVTEEGKVRTSVFNTGERIPEEDLEQIWVKFFKVDKARTREYGGSGVGLSIVKAIMDSHHQKFGVENEEDGVLFWFELEDADGEQRVNERGNTERSAASEGPVRESEPGQETAR